jgi:hypothetical protein
VQFHEGEDGKWKDQRKANVWRLLKVVVVEMKHAQVEVKRWWSLKVTMYLLLHGRLKGGDGRSLFGYAT